MKNLKLMRIDDEEEWLKHALDTTKKNVVDLSLIKAELLDAYKSYEKNVADSTASYPISSFSPSKAVLLDYYDAPPAKLNGLMKARRNDHELDDCPYCGHPRAPDTLDHFVPKDEWPEFSFYPNNLVPQCRGCAPTKGPGYFCSDDKMVLFIHPIFSNLLEKIGFKVEVLFDGAVPDFNVGFTKIAPLPPLETSSLKRHLKKLHVKERFFAYCQKEYHAWLRRSRSTKFDVREAFQCRLREWPNVAGFNTNWEAAFYEGMLKNPDIIQFLNSQCPAPLANPGEVDNFNV